MKLTARWTGGTLIDNLDRLAFSICVHCIGLGHKYSVIEIIVASNVELSGWTEREDEWNI